MLKSRFIAKLTARPYGRSHGMLVSLCLFLCVIYLIFSFFSLAEREARLYQFALTPSGILRGEVWRFFTHALLHGSFWHVTVNVLALWMLGRQAAWTLGRARLMRALLFGILGGAISHWLYCHVTGQDLALVGISGGICAVLALMTCVSPDSKMWPLPVSGKNAWLGFTLTSVLFLMIDPALGIPGLASLGGAIDHLLGRQLFIMGHACHLGGLVTGWCYGKWCLRERVSLASLQRQREKNERKMSSVE